MALQALGGLFNIIQTEHETFLGLFGAGHLSKYCAS